MKDILRAKLELYYLLTKKLHNETHTQSELSIAFALSKDKDIQEMLSKSNKEKKYGK